MDVIFSRFRPAGASQKRAFLQMCRRIYDHGIGGDVVINSTEYFLEWHVAVISRLVVTKLGNSTFWMVAVVEKSCTPGIS